MKTKFFAILVAIALISVAAMPALAQMGYCKVKGKVVDETGKPIVDANVDIVNVGGGQKYHLKTDKKGEYFSLAIAPGVYDVTFSKDGKQLWQLHNYQMSLQKEDSLNVIDIDMAKERERAKTEGQAHMTEEQKKEAEKVQNENNKIKGLNQMLVQSRTAQDSGNLDQAISIMVEATKIDATRDLLWGRLAELQLMSAKKDTDPASRSQKYAESATNYKKAIEIATSATATAGAKAQLGPYNNNLGEALARTGKTEDALAAYNTAAQLDPPNAGNYYFNMGATLTNANKTEEAIAAYDKAIAANPQKPEPYYYKGIALLGKATFKGDKMVPVPGTADAFNKYLELAPDGSLAEPAKQMLASIGAPVTTSFGTGKKKK
jgi:tetratricopeptide (TPR) repeat protein